LSSRDAGLKAVENMPTNYNILKIRLLKYFSSKAFSFLTAYKVIDLYCRNVLNNHGGGNPTRPLA